MLKKTTLFYIFLLLFLVFTFIISFNYGLLIWYFFNFIGNSIIIQQELKKAKKSKTLLVISGFLIVLPIVYIATLLFFLGGITC